MRLYLPMLFAGFALAAVSSAQTALAPGASVAVPFVDYLGTVPHTTVATMNDKFTGLDVSNNVVFTGIAYSTVYLNAASNKLDFLYVFDNDATSMDPIERMSVSGFAGFTTSVLQGIMLAGDPYPYTSAASRTSNGNVLGFSHSVGSTYGPVDPGKESRYVIVETNATTYTTASAQFIDGGVGTAAVFVPKAVPEPTSMAALAIGGLGLMRRRRKA